MINAAGNARLAVRSNAVAVKDITSVLQVEDVTWQMSGTFISQFCWLHSIQARHQCRFTLLHFSNP
jgi:hypothetical protein